MSTSEFKCNLCNENFQENELSTINIKCGHNICDKCLVNFITKNLKAKIKCPLSTCPQQIKDQIIRKCLSNDEIKVYERLSVMGASIKTKKCPMEECPFIFVCDSIEGIFVCDFCESPICIKCNDIHYPQDCSKNTSNKVMFQNTAFNIMKEKKHSEIMELFNSYDLIPNPRFYTCSFCSDFILPGNGVILRNCQHCFCRNCLKETYSAMNYMRQLRCQTCNCKLEDKELNALIGEKQFLSMRIEEAKYLFYHCKKENCVGMWDFTNGISSHKCPECGSDNCMVCHDIHIGMSCAKFKESTIYKESIKTFETMKIKSTVNCKHCNSLLIKKGGCNAIFCCHCGHNTCLLTGLFAGKHDTKVCGCQGSESCDLKKYCGCTSTKPCHPQCLYGCFIE